MLARKGVSITLLRALRRLAYKSSSQSAKRESEREARERARCFPCWKTNQMKSFWREFLRTAVGEGVGGVKSNCHLIHAMAFGDKRRSFLRFVLFDLLTLFSGSHQTKPCQNLELIDLISSPRCVRNGASVKLKLFAVLNWERPQAQRIVCLWCN